MSIAWSEIEFGLQSKYMRRTMKALKWLVSGAQLSFPSRTIAMTTTKTGGPYFVFKATINPGPTQEFVALGSDPDLNILFSMVKETTDDSWEALETEAEKHGY